MLSKLDERSRAAFACPACHHSLAVDNDRLVCSGCGHGYLSTAGYPDFAPELPTKSGLGQFYLQDPLHVPRYEQETRVAFLNIMGANWDDELSPEDEDDYLRKQLSAVRGPLLDLACGAGRWTRTLVEQVGAANVIGLDVSPAMLGLIRRELPELCVVRGTALKLPFAPGTLDAVNCSNALQLLPDPRAVLAEVGRCLRPGGLFTAFTFRQAERPTYRHFQRRHEQTFNVRSFSVTELVTWLGSAGLELIDLKTPANMILLTARRTHA